MTEASDRSRDLDFKEYLSVIQQEPSVERRLQLCEQYLDSGTLGEEQTGVVYGCTGACYFERAHERLRALAGTDPSPSDLAAVQHDLRESVQYYTSAIGIYPVSLNYLNRGLCYEYLGDLEQALNDYTQTVSSDAEFAHGYLYRARVLYQMGDTERAADDFVTAYRLEPNLLTGTEPT
jgi:tetratricopeptide (TPR) repeat protein